MVLSSSIIRHSIFILRISALVTARKRNEVRGKDIFFTPVYDSVIAWGRCLPQHSMGSMSPRQTPLPPPNRQTLHPEMVAEAGGMLLECILVKLFFPCSVRL